MIGHDDIPHLPQLRGGTSLVTHPAVQDFATFVTTRYIPPAGKRVALFLPCTSKKPYSSSRTYRTINSVLTGFPPDAADVIHVLTVSEPLGVVPAELERAYPAAHYDMVLKTWFPIRRSRTGNFTSKKGQLTSEDRRCLDLVVDRVFRFLNRLSGHYEFFVGYVRGSQRRMLEIAAERASVRVIY
ncbi:MAG TPA: DUF5591 domain-containing protein, partial [Candidatus Bathyarchaeia archaeon]